jgi:formylglycine-generating enzyme required for sulfatase activity
VTQAQWEAVMGSNPSQFNDDPSRLVENLSWNDAQQFVVKLNVAATRGVPSAGQQQTTLSPRISSLPSPTSPLSIFELKYALPAEAQWEYACRAGTAQAFCFGDDQEVLGEYAWFADNSAESTHLVGQLEPNAWGLCDVHGNVWEWCADWHAADYYAQSPPTDPIGAPTGSERVRRGGGWDNRPGRCRSAHRRNASPDHRHGNLGLRLAAVLVEGQVKREPVSGAGPSGAAIPPSTIRNRQAKPRIPRLSPRPPISTRP